MSYLGIQPNDFNPNILFCFKNKYNYNSQLQSKHTHDFININYIASGTCQYIINDKTYKVRKADVIIINPYSPHFKKIIPNQEISELSIGINNINFDDLSKNNFIDNNKFPVISMEKYKQDLYTCYHEIISVQEKRDIGWELMNKILIMKFIVIILKETCRIKSEKIENYFNFESYDKNTIVNTIIIYINENYMEKISLDEISQNTFLSSTYILKIFKEITGDTFINYLINIRINKAKEILKEGHFSIQEVAKKIGYEDAYYFSKLFKKKYGCSPSEYKKNFI